MSDATCFACGGHLSPTHLGRAIQRRYGSITEGARAMGEPVSTLRFHTAGKSSARQRSSRVLWQRFCRSLELTEEQLAHPFPQPMPVSYSDVLQARIAGRRVLLTKRQQNAVARLLANPEAAPDLARAVLRLCREVLP